MTRAERPPNAPSRIRECIKTLPQTVTEIESATGISTNHIRLVLSAGLSFGAVGVTRDSKTGLNRYGLLKGRV